MHTSCLSVCLCQSPSSLLPLASQGLPQTLTPFTCDQLLSEQCTYSRGMAGFFSRICVSTSTIFSFMYLISSPFLLSPILLIHLPSPSPFLFLPLLSPAACLCFSHSLRFLTTLPSLLCPFSIPLPLAHLLVIHSLSSPSAPLSHRC